VHCLNGYRHRFDNFSIFEKLIRDLMIN
jgi:hypothetical protein